MPYPSVLNHSLTEEHLGICQFGAILNEAAVSSSVQVSEYYFSLWWVPLHGYTVFVCLLHLRSSLTFPDSLCYFTFPPAVRVIQCLCILANIWFCHYLCISNIPIDVKWYCLVTVICIFLLANNEFLFMHLLDVYISSSMQCIFMCFFFPPL